METLADEIDGLQKRIQTISIKIGANQEDLDRLRGLLGELEARLADLTGNYVQRDSHRLHSSASGSAGQKSATALVAR